MELADWRSRIDELNVKLLELLNERARCAQAIAKLKGRQGLPTHDPEREKQVIDSMLAGNRGPLSDAAVRRIFAGIMVEHRKLQDGDST